MASFTANDVKSLREKTGVGMMDCKKALTEADGDFERAVDILRERGLAAATKKAGRITAEGAVLATYNKETAVAVLLEVNAETDFVGKNETFRAFLANIAATISENAPENLDVLLASNLVGSLRTVEETRQEMVLTIGENLNIRRFVRIEGTVATYIHGGGSIGVLVRFEADPLITKTDLFAEFGKNVAMQVAAMNPLYLNEAAVPEETKAHETEIYKAQIAEDPKLAGKPAQVIDGVVRGKLGKYYKEVCLADQTYFRDDKLSIAQYVASVEKELGSPIKVVDFYRFAKGEDIEKKQDDFVAEVAKMVQ